MNLCEGRVEVEPGLRVYWRRQGEAGPAVVVPGAAQLAGDLEPLASGRTLIFFDQRNRGQSDAVNDPSRLAVSYEVSDLETLRRQLGLERFALVGWSYQSGVVALYAMAHPERVVRLAIIGPLPPHRPQLEQASRLWAEAERRVDPADLQRLQQMRADGLNEKDPIAYCRQYRKTYMPRQMGNPAGLTRMRSDPCRFANEHPDRLYPLLFEHVMPSFGDWDWRPGLASLRLPVLIVAGERDLVPIEAVREWTEHLPNARLLVLPGVGHFPWLEAPERFFLAMDTFLNGDWPDGAGA